MRGGMPLAPRDGVTSPSLQPRQPYSVPPAGQARSASSRNRVRMVFLYLQGCPRLRLIAQLYS